MDAQEDSDSITKNVKPEFHSTTDVGDTFCSSLDDIYFHKDLYPPYGSTKSFVLQLRDLGNYLTGLPFRIVYCDDIQNHPQACLLNDKVQVINVNVFRRIPEEFKSRVTQEQLDDLQLYQIQLKHGPFVWSVIRKWSKNTILWIMGMRGMKTIYMHKVNVKETCCSSKRCTSRKQNNRRSSITVIGESPANKVFRQLDTLLKKIYMHGLIYSDSLFTSHILQFLGVSRYSFVENTGPRKYECHLQVTISRHGVYTNSKQIPAWMAMKGNYIVFLTACNGAVIDVILVDRHFQIEDFVNNKNRQACRKERQNIRTLIRISNNQMDVDLSMKIFYYKHVITELNSMKNSVYYGPVPDHSQLPIKSFASKHDNTPCKWYVDGASYFFDMADALEQAKEEIFITGWFLSPEFLLKRPCSGFSELINILCRKATYNVQIFILLYSELSIMNNDSKHTQESLFSRLKQTKNIHFMKHPNRKKYTMKRKMLREMVFSHHEKLVIIDQTIAFFGGLDLCWGRWDLPTHSIVDNGEEVNQNHFNIPIINPVFEPYRSPDIRYDVLHFVETHCPTEEKNEKLTVAMVQSERDQLHATSLPSLYKHFCHWKNHVTSTCSSCTPLKPIIQAYKLDGKPVHELQEFQFIAPESDSISNTPLCMGISLNCKTSPTTVGLELQQDEQNNNNRTNSNTNNILQTKNVNNKRKVHYEDLNTENSMKNQEKLLMNYIKKDGKQRQVQQGHSKTAKVKKHAAKPKILQKIKIKRKVANAWANDDQTSKNYAMNVDDATKFQMFKGMDYINWMLSVPADMTRPYEDATDRKQNPRTAWHDIGCVVRSNAARDVARHFIERWNFTRIKLRKRHLPALIPKALMNQTEVPINTKRDFGKSGQQCKIVKCHCHRQQQNLTPIEEDCLNDQVRDSGVTNCTSTTTNATTSQTLDNESQNLSVKMQAETEEESEDDMHKELQFTGKQCIKTLEAIAPASYCRVQILRNLSLWSGGCKEAENSIYQAYVHLINKAEHYIYIENQFFISACRNSSKIENKLMRAIFYKILAMHQAKIPFKVYFTIPALPLFSANTRLGIFSGPVRYILSLIYRTIFRGGNSLFDRLKESDIDPLKYVTVCSLRMWGKLPSINELVTEQIYVHSKLMIVDDRYAIIGSANINDRSMTGFGDSEIAAVFEDYGKDLTPAYWFTGKAMVGRFCGSLRRYLMREHMDIHWDTNERLELLDPTHDNFFHNKWNSIAISNRYIYEKVFKTSPNGCKTNEELDEYLKEPGLAETDIEEAEKYLTNNVKGHLVQHPGEFLESEDLEIPKTVPDKIVKRIMYNWWIAVWK